MLALLFALLLAPLSTATTGWKADRRANGRAKHRRSGFSQLPSRKGGYLVKRPEAVSAREVLMEAQEVAILPEYSLEALAYTRARAEEEARIDAAWDRIARDVTEEYCFICSRVTDHRGEHYAEELL